MAKTIEAEFMELACMTIPADAPAVQFQECRRFFFAGCYMMFCRLVGESVGGTMTDDEGAAMLAELQAECEQFAADVATGKK